jgi:hypothetical protein
MAKRVGLRMNGLLECSKGASQTPSRSVILMQRRRSGRLCRQRTSAVGATETDTGFRTAQPTMCVCTVPLLLPLPSLSGLLLGRTQYRCVQPARICVFCGCMPNPYPLARIISVNVPLTNFEGIFLLALDTALSPPSHRHCLCKGSGL